MYLLQRSPHREGLDGLVVRLRLRHALVDPLVRDGVVLLFLRALALDALEGDDFVERDRREDQRGSGGEERSRRRPVAFCPPGALFGGRLQRPQVARPQATALLA